MKILLSVVTGLLFFHPTYADDDIVDFGAGQPELTTLKVAVIRAGLVDDLQNLNQGTLLAPNNAAFAALPPALFTALVTNDEFLPHLVDLLLLHVLRKDVLASNLREGRSNKKSLNTENVQFDVDFDIRHIDVVGDNFEKFPLGLCEGDCDSDDDCASFLVCSQRNGLKPVRGCSGTGVAGKDYCTYPGSDHLKKKRKSSSRLLGFCEGDCDDDHDCLRGLTCFQRDGNETVPGCRSKGSRKRGKGGKGGSKGGSKGASASSKGSLSSTDYCTWIPPPVKNTLKYVADNRLAFPLGQCEGDCDANRDCQDGLKCIKRRDNIPGCLGTAQVGRDYCAIPGSSRLTIKGDNNSPSSEFPLGICQGDCDDKHDCDDGLLCFQRKKTTDLVPGCRGSGQRKKDYCFKTPMIEAEGKCNAGSAPKVVNADNEVSNGVVHIIDGVLLPTWACKTILDRVKDRNDLSILLELLVRAGLDGALDQPLQELTLLAPNNRAFNALPNADLNFLNSTAGTNALIRVLRYHGLRGIFTIDEFTNGQKVRTFQGTKNVTVSLTPLRFNSATTNASARKKDILANNGVMHKINKVLNPADG